MKRFSTHLYGTVFASLLFAGSITRADSFTIQWDRDDPIKGGAVLADAGGTGGVSFTNMQETKPISIAPSTNGTPPPLINTVASNLSTFSSANNGAFDSFTNAPWAMTVTLKDLASGTSGKLTFTGVVNGQLNTEKSSVSVTIDSLNAIQTLALGAHVFTVTLDTTVPPAEPGNQNFGSIGGHIKVEGGGGGIEHTPEPSGIVLSALGLSCLAVAAWRRKLRGRKAADSV
jgi:hypothetical protein